MISWVWMARRFAAGAPRLAPAPARSIRLPWRNPQAWLVALYFGASQFVVYALFAWMAPAATEADVHALCRAAATLGQAVAQALPAGGLVVVATQGRRDLQALRAALALQPQTLWFVASERKAGVLRESLVGAGEDPSRVAAIVAPAGEPIGAQTPEEIALAVLATVVAARRGRPVRASAPTPAEKPAPKFRLDLPPMEMGSCCGGGADKPEQAESVVEATPPVVAAKSCCGG